MFVAGVHILNIHKWNIYMFRAVKIIYQGHSMERQETNSKSRLHTVQTVAMATVGAVGAYCTFCVYLRMSTV